jgi:hypothetical protein
MADTINKKISIDVEVNTDGQQQINQYKAAFDSLRTSINSLSNPLTDLSKNMDAINKNVAQTAAGTEKNTGKMLAAAKQASDQQAKINAASNKNLKGSLSEADKMQKEAMELIIYRKYSEYDALTTLENDKYTERKKMLDNMLAYKHISQRQHNQEAEKLKKEHFNNLRGIMQQYIDDVKNGQEELKAASVTNIDPAAISQPEIKAIPLPLPKPEEKKKIFKALTNIFKKAFSNIFSIYKTGVDDSSKAAADSAAKTDTKIADAAKALEDKRRASIIDSTQKTADSVFTIITKGIDAQSAYGVSVLEKEKNNALKNTTLTAAEQQNIKDTYAKQELAIKVKAFKETQKVSVAQAIINGAIAITKADATLGPIAGTIAIGAIIANTAAQIATIAKQQPPAMAKGGFFKSDGKGTILPGYSKQDDTNAYLRSGEAVVVSEAMQVPWARNLVSAINVGFGGRSFSVPGTSRGYAVGGIFTDGGDANRYYNQPVNDQKNLANTIAYQMINNFPPVYVDVKDVNNQQNILAQTINRVNL